MEPINQEKSKIDSSSIIPEAEEKKKRFVSINDLMQKESKIVSIFDKSKKKIIETKPGLFLRPHNCNFKSKEYISSFQYECTFPLKVKQEFSFIYDSLNFICYQPQDEEDSKNQDKYISKLKSIFSYLKDKGTILLLIDEFHIDNFFPNLLSFFGNDYKTKLFINFYFLDYRPFLFLVSIQKMTNSDTPIVTKDLKILITDFFSNSKLIGSSTLSQMNKYLEEPLLRMKAYRFQNEKNYNRIKSLHPGQFYEMRLKSSPLNHDVSYIVTIYDSPNPFQSQEKKVFAVAVNYEISSEIIFFKQISFSKMTEQMRATRLIILESAILNPCNIQDLVFALESEIQMMKPEGFGGDIPLRLWENHANKYTLFENEKFLIKDSEDQRRQIYLKDKFNVLFGEEITKLTSKTNIANPPKGTIYFPIETQDKYKENRVVQCVDENIVHGFYEQSLLCTVFYMDLSKFPRNTAKIMDIGAGLGDLSFNFYKLFKGGCEIYNIEKDKEIYEIGMKYFGYKDYDVEKRVTWIFEDYKTCVEKMAKFSELNTNKTKKLNEKKYGNKLNYFDLICMQMKEFNKKENTLPSKEFFEDSYLENIKNLLKPYGIYVVKLIANNFKAFHDNYKQLEKHFISIFTIPSEGGLAYIFFCFKDKIEIAEYQEKFKKNKEIIEKNNVIEFSVVKTFANTIFSQLEDMAEQKKKIEENSKRF